MPTLKTLSSYGMFLFGLAVIVNLGLFFLAWLRG